MTLEETQSRGLVRLLAARGIEVRSLTLLPGDVSRRQYWRLKLSGGTSAIAVAYPADMEHVCRRFLATTEILGGVSVRVPEILDADCSSGITVLEDLGPDTLYSSARGEHHVAERVREALTLIAKIRRLPVAPVAGLSPPLDRRLLSAELEITWDRALTRAELSGPRESRTALRSALELLVARLEAAPLEPCHRDFMIRNLMVSPQGELAVIDHQDLRLGPRHYDLASLLNDSFFPHPHLERRLRERLAPEPADVDQYRRCAVQRCLKAVGTFVGFAATGNRSHLALVPATLSRAAHHLARLPEGEALGADLDRRWSPDRVAAIEWP